MKPPGMTGSGRTLNQRKLCMKIHLTKAVNCLPYMTEDLKFIPRNPPYKHTQKKRGGMLIISTLGRQRQEGPCGLPC